MVPGLAREGEGSQAGVGRCLTGTRFAQGVNVRALRWIGGVVLVLFVAIALFLAVGLNTLREPIANAVTKATGRELVIEGDLKPVWSWLHPRIRVEGVTFANAEWGKADYLLNANAIEASVSVLPLLVGRIVLPEVHLEGAELALERDADGRRNWLLKDEEDKKEESRFYIKLLTLDEGRLVWDDATTDTRVEADLSTDETGVSFEAQGKWKGMDMKSLGHAGHVLSIRDRTTPFPLKGDITIGQTSAKLDGTITGLVGFKGIDLQFERLSGKSLDDLYNIIGLAFPATSPYTVSGRLYRTDGVWMFENFAGKVGESDLAGTIRVQTGEDKRPLMQGEINAKVLNLADLGALVGTGEPRKSGVLPDMPFSPERWNSVDADVKINAGTIKRPEQLPIDRFNTRVRMDERVLKLDPLAFGIAGGRLEGTVTLDGNYSPLRGDVKMRVQNLQLQDRRLHGRGQNQPVPHGARRARSLGRRAPQAARRQGDRHPLRDRGFRREGRRDAGERDRVRHRGGECAGRRQHQPQDRGDGHHAQARAQGPQHRLAEQSALHPRHVRRAGCRPRHGQTRRQGRGRNPHGNPQSAPRCVAAPRAGQGQRLAMRPAHRGGDEVGEGVERGEGEGSQGERSQREGSEAEGSQS